MSDKIKLIVIAVVIISSFAIGRYTAKGPDVSKTETKQTDTQTQKDQDKHKQTTTVTVKHPDGTETSTTTTTEDVKTTTTKDSKSDVISSQTSTSPRSKINASALVAYSQGQINYGGSVSKEVLGNITAGVYGLNNGTIGLSIGVNF